MTAVDRPDNGQDEGPMCVSIGHEDVPATVSGVYDDGDHRESGVIYCDECARQDVFTPTERLASGRAGAGEQQRELVARFLVSVAYGPRTDGENWFDHLIPAGQEKFLTHADELLALLGGPQPDGGPEPCPVYSHDTDGWHCSVEGPHDQHQNAAGDETW